MQVSIYRYNPDVDEVPSMREMEVDLPEGKDLMVLDVLELMKTQDSTLSYRRSGGIGSKLASTATPVTRPPASSACRSSLRTT